MKKKKKIRTAKLRVSIMEKVKDGEMNIGTLLTVVEGGKKEQSGGREKEEL